MLVKYNGGIASDMAVGRRRATTATPSFDALRPKHRWVSQLLYLAWESVIRDIQSWACDINISGAATNFFRLESAKYL
jgi:hypothetical protein